MALDLADDRRHRERGELVAAAGVVALDRVQQADRARLHEVVVLGVGACVALRERLDQRQVELDEPVAGPDVAVLAIGANSRPVAVSRSLRPCSAVPLTLLQRAREPVIPLPTLTGIGRVSRSFMGHDRRGRVLALVTADSHLDVTRNGPCLRISTPSAARRSRSAGRDRTCVCTRSPDRVRGRVRGPGARSRALRRRRRRTPRRPWATDVGRGGRRSGRGRREESSRSSREQTAGGPRRPPEPPCGEPLQTERRAGGGRSDRRACAGDRRRLPLGGRLELPSGRSGVAERLRRAAVGRLSPRRRPRSPTQPLRASRSPTPAATSTSTSASSAPAMTVMSARVKAC